MLLECLHILLGNIWKLLFLSLNINSRTYPLPSSSVQEKPMRNQTLFSKCIGLSWNETVINSTCTWENGFLSRDKSHQTQNLQIHFRVGSAVWQTGKNKHAVLGSTRSKRLKKSHAKNKLKRTDSTFYPSTSCGCLLFIDGCLLRLP